MIPSNACGTAWAEAKEQMSERFTAARMQGLVQSDIRRLTIECEKIGGINMGQGICDLPTHPLVAEGAIAAIREGKATYTHAMGILELRRKLADKLLRFNGLRYNPESEVCITVGSSGAFAAGLFATLDPGSEAVLIEPYYGYHLNTLLLAGVVPRYARLDLATMKLNRASVEQAISARTRALVLCTPSNPSGMVYSEDDIRWLGQLAERHDLLLFSDEIYEYIVYGGQRHISVASMGNLRERTLTLGGYSKTFSITGWRIGYLAGPEAIIRRAAVVSDLLYVCAPHPLQRGVLRGLDAPESYYEEMRRQYEHDRDALCAALEQGGFVPYRPQGSYYVMADFSRLGWTDDQAASRELLARAKIAAIPGGAFYEPGSGRGSKLLRFCYAKPADALAEACQRLAKLKP